LPGGADIKLIWELSRWYQLVRLAMAAYVLGDERAVRKCIEWLEDWVKHNPPYAGWNWTSALEAGLRLVQFAWIDALLGTATSGSARGEDGSAMSGSTKLQSRLERLRRGILPAHAWFAWRHKSFGSSANNHLIGELTGLIVATARWPALARWGAPLERLQALWEREVLAQFAEDGGNKEQALHYHLFSWEFCWQAMNALHQVGGRGAPPEVSERLYRAAEFFVKVQVEKDPWDYGDSDNAVGTPFGSGAGAMACEWRQWFISRQSSPAIDFWLGQTRRDFKEQLVRVSKLGGGPEAPRPKSQVVASADLPVAWITFANSGLAVCRSGFWTLRWDASPLGYLRTAAHGHLDALHLSLWFKGVAVVVDPGTGAYYPDPRLRAWLASREAHNGPHPVGLDFPRRLGPFLWSGHHAIPALRVEGEVLAAELALPAGRVMRRLKASPAALSWSVEDTFTPASKRTDGFTVRWQFAPGCWVKKLDKRKYQLNRAEASVVIEVDESWAEVQLVELAADEDQKPVSTDAGSLEGIVSPAFRKICRAPYLKLLARPEPGKPCVFRTSFLASPGA
jgi:hypothetical protein